VHVIALQREPQLLQALLHLGIVTGHRQLVLPSPTNVMAATAE
jgi:hypothetical protein